ncbi:hypothetical protein DL95DRAFT_445088 [Leptodontidium sp. 2 PMI_412]|nr:hypothetical protein DL95DRAFT_445088 [Leptodontidium sp. 2 PMI_412]
MTRGNKSKRARDLALVQNNRGQMVMIESDEEPSLRPANSKSKPKKNTNSKGRNSKQATVEDLDDQDELGEEISYVGVINKAKDKCRKAFTDLATAAELLSTMDTVADIEQFLHRNGLQTDEDINHFAEQCGSISRLLRSKVEHNQGETTVALPGVVETFDMFYMLRDGTTRMKLLAPVEVIHGTGSIKSKVIGFIRHRGKYWPLMFSISGLKDLVPEHPKVLDSEIWSRLAFTWGDDFGHLFRPNGWESHRGAAKGTDFASHVEPKLMLWFATREWTKLSGQQLPLEKQVKRLWELQDLQHKIVAEVVLDRVPCDCCKEFKRRLEKFTGHKLRFKFMICPNVAVMDSVFNKHGAKVNRLPEPQRAMELEEDEEEKEDEDPKKDDEIGQRRNTRVSSQSQSSFEIVIHSGPSTPSKDLEHRPSRPTDSPKNQSPEVTRTHIVTQRDRIRSYEYRSTSSAPDHYLAIDIDSDESDWQPSGKARRTSKQHSTPPNSSKFSGLPTPSQSLFPQDAQRKAADIKKNHKKRRSNMADTSPSLGKKSRRTKF